MPWLKPLSISVLLLSMVGLGSETIARWPQAVDAAARELSFHGVVLVQSHGEVIVNKAFGETSSQANSETPYWVASISKSFTATLIFRLQEQGALSLHDTLGRFFPDVPSDKRGITIEELLTHTSGLPNKYISEGVVVRGEAVRRILHLSLIHAPGQAFAYTNDGYSLLGAIAEVAGHTPYGQLLKRDILDPARMTSSGLWPVCPGPLPVLPLSETLPPAVSRENWGFKGPDGICSTTADLARLMNALRTGKILQPDSLEAMWSGKLPVSDGHVTAGWFRSTSARGSQIIWTRGTDHGHNSILKYYPEKDLVVISLSSSKDPEGPLLARMLVNKLEAKLEL